MNTPELQIYVDGALVNRAEARVSVFDAGFQSGDGIWEGIRVYGGRVFELNAHVDRLFDSARALSIEAAHAAYRVSQHHRGSSANNLIP